MTNFWLGAFIGGLFGATFAVMLMSAMRAAATADRQMDEWLRKDKDAR
jgi:hypothetical protein